MIIKYYPEYEEEVTWTLDGEKNVVETIKRANDRTEARKKGQLPTPDGIEDFTEVFWESPNESAREKA